MASTEIRIKLIGSEKPQIRNKREAWLVCTARLLICQLLISQVLHATSDVLMSKLTNPPRTKMFRIAICILVFLRTDVEAKVTFDKPPSGRVPISIVEDIATGSGIYTLQVTDPAGNSPSFTIWEQSPPTPAFSIDETSHQLIVPNQGLDAETTTQFNFTFRVTAGPFTVNSGLLIVRVTDVNDNEPVFGNTSHKGEIWKNDPADINITTVIATDPDVSNLSISYSIVGAQTIFSISSSGVITLADPVGLTSLASPTVLVLQVHASDAERTGTTTVSITVHDNPCSATPCENGGTCNSTRDNYTCSCVSGYRGQQCQSVDYCHQSRCQNSGTCLNAATNYTCSCTPLYTGQICAETILSKMSACTSSTFLIGITVAIASMLYSAY